ncbi:MAG: hypothetical protein WCJ62_02290, partial [Flavobacterium sp.]
DYLLSRQYSLKEFYILPKYATQDDRRFKYMGYGKFLKMMFKNYLNRNNIEYFRLVAFGCYRIESTKRTFAFT